MSADPAAIAAHVAPRAVSFAHLERLSETLRDYAAAQAIQGQLRQAAEAHDRALAIAEKLSAAAPAAPRYSC